MLRTVGERPGGPFGGLRVSELGILIGGVALVVGLLEHRGAAILVGSVVCALAVLELTAREHFSASAPTRRCSPGSRRSESCSVSRPRSARPATGCCC